ncbi:hypothetical protein [Flavobacterium sp. UBA6046]|jgi:hypothetical protein|uniref:hypothetical protein n=1 Tax=Flavobacterium sp. UBA6046 TaxID=1946552 RepID=UPI0025C090DE|nr:hypothetical protein [Flavobacterium sp. UBA6046]
MKNLVELKTKKMSLANIESRLTPAEMENIMAGSGFWGAFACGVGVGTIVVGTYGATSWVAVGIYATCLSLLD